MAEPLNATFFALRNRGRRGVLLRATLAFTLVTVALFGAGAALFAWVMGVDLAALLQASWRGGLPSSTPPDPARALWLIPFVLFGAFVYAVLLAAYESACLRWMVRGEVRGWWGLTVDDDAWRVYGAYWVWCGIYLVWLLAYWIVSALFNRLLGEGHWGVWLAIGLLGVCVLFSVVSLAPATATIIAKRRFAFFEALNVSDDRFGALLGSFALIFGAQGAIQWGANFAWWTSALGPGWFEHFAGVRDYFSFTLAQSNVVTAAMQVSGVSMIWIMSIGSWVVSMFSMVLVFGVNARAAALALEEGKLRQEVA